jgi:hypothetical protein
VCAEDAVEVPMPATVEKVDIEIGEEGGERVGVILLMANTILINPGNGDGTCHSGDIPTPLEEVTLPHAFKGNAAIAKLDTACLRQVEADNTGMGAQYREGVMVSRRGNPRQCRRIGVMLFVICHRLGSLFTY